MKSKRFVLTFPPDSTGEPITYNLIRKFNVMVNIVKADISPGKVGHLVMELTGATKMIRESMDYITQLNVVCVPIDKKITYDEDNCIHCGACTSVCFAGALTMKHSDGELSFNPEKCVVCELCVKSCPLRLFKIDIE